MKTETIVKGKVAKIDNVKTAFQRVTRKLAADATHPVVITKPLKLLRKTAATRLGGHPEFGKFTQYFLGHAAGTIADRHYVAPNESQFDAALAWLRAEFVSTK